ncbi:AtpZ/AtpI family protein [Rhodovulum sp. DZ06]|uniref:AtpZ/AtpI family protein n=1 Tax=Rhodovulum sp. DZ06 TaxID=3425126 RepID=UPI003D34CDA2
MTPADEDGDAAREQRLQSLDAKLADLRKRRAPPPPRKGGGRFAGHEMAWSMVIDLTAGIVVGGGMGWGLDVVFGTKPLFLILLVLFGFAAGVRVMLQTAAEHQKRQARRAAAEAGGQDEAGGTQGAAAGPSGNNTGAAAPRNEGL